MNWLNLIDRRLMIAVAIAATISAMIGFGFWSMSKSYGVAFSNVTGKDGGAIIAALEQMNVQYKVSEGGATILVAADQVPQVRLKLAAMGLPKSTNSGYELLENQKFGVSQFVEQTNFQRAIIGELERSIQSINSIDQAKVMIGLPKQTVFVRDQQKPTASVMLKLHSGRSLTEHQVNAIVHLVATSVADLHPTNISVVDQSGTLLWDPAKKHGASQIDTSQLKHINEVQNQIVKRIESLLIPIAGAKNIRAEATVEIDFSNSEQAEEIYKPNKDNNVAVRNQQINETPTVNPMSAMGVPGAASNLPSPQTQASGNSSVAPQSGDANQAPQTGAVRNSVTNFEIDKTLRYSQKGVGSIKRLSVAVVLNNKRLVDSTGRTEEQSWTESEISKVTALTRDAMGYSSTRGDTLTVINMPFAANLEVERKESETWQLPLWFDSVKSMSKILIDLIIFLAIYRLVLRPLIRRYVTNKQFDSLIEPSPSNGTTIIASDATNRTQIENVTKTGYEAELDKAKMLAKDDPKIVANIISSWLNKNG
jgi:flagellar M-ring protein FliF